MRRSRTGRGDRIVHALDLEGRRQTGRIGRGHAARDHERPHPLGRAFFDHDLVGIEEVRGRRPARAHDQAGARIGDIAFFQPGICDRLLHGDEVIGRTRTHEAQVALVDMVFQHDLGHAVDLAAKAVLGIFRRENDAGSARLQAFGDFLGIVADGRDDPQPGDDDAAHARSSSRSFKGAAPMIG